MIDPYLQLAGSLLDLCGALVWQAYKAVGADTWRKGE